MSNGANNTAEITRNVEDALTFPILTKEVDGLGGGADLTRTGIPGGTSLGRLAQDTIRGVLGWRYRADDVKGFTAALTKSFQLREVEGHVEWDFKPQFYMVQADLGEITGAQASIYTRAKVALEQTLPLLDGLKPLRPDVDDEDVQAMRAIVRTELSELVQELGAVGGPRVQRGDSIFGLLLGNDPGSHYDKPENVEGQLGELRDRLGLERQRVNTIGEEQNFTNFIILVDYTNSLHQTWISQRGFFVRDSSDPFLGTELVLLSQLLEVIAESVRDAAAAMDSVNFGPAERQTTELLLTLDGGVPHPMTVAELLDWVENFATVEGRQLLQDGGKDGVVVFRFTLSRLLQLVNQAFEISRQPSGNPTRGYHTARVRSSLEEIKLHLTSALGRANKLDRSQIAYVEEPKPDDQKFPPVFPVPPEPRPIILEISPGTGEPGETVAAEIKGRHFRNPGVALGDGINLTIISPPTPDKISVSIDIAGNAEPGFRNLVVTNADGSWGELVAFEVLPPDDHGDVKPKIRGISPDCLQQGAEKDDATVEGTNLPLGAAVNLGEGVYFFPTDWRPGVITGKLKVDLDAPLGKRNLKVFSDGKRGAKMRKAFTVLPRHGREREEDSEQREERKERLRDILQEFAREIRERQDEFEWRWERRFQRLASQVQKSAAVAPDEPQVGTLFGLAKVEAAEASQVKTPLQQKETEGVKAQEPPVVGLFPIERAKEGEAAEPVGMQLEQKESEKAEASQVGVTPEQDNAKGAEALQVKAALEQKKAEGVEAQEPSKFGLFPIERAKEGEAAEQVGMQLGQKESEKAETSQVGVTPEQDKAKEADASQMGVTPEQDKAKVAEAPQTTRDQNPK